jgi:hypothetical protein
MRFLSDLGLPRPVRDLRTARDDMHTPNATTIPALPALTSGLDARSAKILARTIFRDMKQYGIPNQRILEVASELIRLVTDEIADDTQQPKD